MASPLSIVCESCGAKYRLPETYTNDKAKCKACGGTMDVAKQRQRQPASVAAGGAAPAAKPAAPAPAAAPTAAAPASAAARPSRVVRAEAADTATRPHHEYDPHAARRARQQELQKIIKIGWMIAGGLILVTLIVVMVVKSKHDHKREVEQAVENELDRILGEIRSQPESKQGWENIIKIAGDNKDTIKRTRIAPEVAAAVDKAHKRLDVLRKSENVVQQLDSLDSQLSGGPGVEQLKDMFNKVRELEAECQQTGPEFETRRVELRKRIDHRYIEQLTQKATGDAATATEGKHLLAAGDLDDLLKRLLEEAKVINDAEALAALDPLSKTAFRSSNQAAVTLFTPEYQGRIPAKDLLAGGLSDWVVTPSETMKFNITGQGIVMTNQGEGAKSAGVSYEPALNWRDYVIEIEFRVDSGTMAFYTRVGRDDKMDSKAVPAFTAGTKNTNLGIDYGKVYQGIISVVGDQFTVTMDQGLAAYDDSQGRLRSRKGRIGIVCQPDSSFTISRLKVRHLR